MLQLQQKQISHLHLQQQVDHGHPGATTTIESSRSKYVSMDSGVGEDIVNDYLYGMDSASIEGDDAPLLTSPACSSIDSSSASRSLDGLLDTLSATLQELEMEDGVESASPSDMMAPAMPRNHSAVYSVGCLLQSTSAFYGYLNKLSLSKATGQRQWKSRFFVLVDCNLYLFRSNHPTELPMTFLPLSGASRAIVDDPERLPTQQSGLYVPEWILDVRGSGYSPDGSIVERAWALHSHDESVMLAWLHRLVPVVAKRRGSVPDSALPALRSGEVERREILRGGLRRESLGSSTPLARLAHLQASSVAAPPPELMIRRPSDALFAHPTGVSTYHGTTSTSPVPPRQVLQHGYAVMDSDYKFPIPSAPYLTSQTLSLRGTSPVSSVNSSLDRSFSPAFSSAALRPTLIVHTNAASNDQSQLISAFPEPLTSTQQQHQEAEASVSSDMIMLGDSAPSMLTRKPSQKRSAISVSPRNEWPSTPTQSSSLFHRRRPSEDAGTRPFMSFKDEPRPSLDSAFSVMRVAKGLGSSCEKENEELFVSGSAGTGGMMKRLLGRAKSIKKSLF
ncbi:hypothetical protein HDU67_008327 [Dinochytrium kinnereticum]|nr:hypothetical protein HDU67_008327 [Dinochytrium kinnereticum]